MEKVNNFLYYVILLAVFGFCAYFLHSRYLFIIAVIFVIFPFVGFFAAKYVSKKLELRVKTPSLWVPKNEETAIQFVFKNKTFIPILNCIVVFNAENRFYPNTQHNSINISVPCAGEYTASLPLTPVYNGMINIKILKVEVRDVLNLFSFECKNTADHHFYVIPSSRDEELLPALSELYSEDSLILAKNVNGTQVDGIREYVQGDKLRNIHWKLSARHNGLLVNEYSDNNEETTVVLAELYAAAADDILDRVYSIGKSLVKHAYPFTLAFAPAGSEQLTKLFITDEQTLSDGIELIYLSHTSLDDRTSLAALRREYAGSGVIYIHGGDEGKAVTEII